MDLVMENEKTYHLENVLNLEHGIILVILRKGTRENNLKDKKDPILYSITLLCSIIKINRGQRE